MNLNNAALLVRDDIKTIGVQFPGTPKTYTYVLHNSIPVNYGDIIVVQAKQSVNIAEVIDIHEDVEIDPMNEMTYKWVVSNITTEAKKIEDEILATDKIIAALKKQQQRSVREQILAQFGISSVNELLEAPHQ